ncbi:MAG: FAD binding domain-containing protein [Planctomycetes bacterium]|nr:FAD binding domain-containing protein [Planctomycetota bacterium]
MMRLPKFTYVRAKSVREAVRVMADAGPDASFVAGGTDLYPNMKRRQQTPKTVIGLSGVRELRRIAGKPETGLVIGAGATLTEVCEHSKVRKGHPALAKAVSLISTPILRNMGTIGGNVLLDTRCNYYDQNYEWRKGIHFCMKKDGDVCWVAPSSSRCWAVQSSDAVPVLCAIGARVALASQSGEREIAAVDLFRDDGIDYLTKRPDELLTEIRLPATNGWRATYWKLRRRGSFDFPVLSVAARLWFDGATVKDAKIILGAVGSSPLDAHESARLLIGKPLTEDTIRAAADAAYKPAKPLDNTDFAYAFRKEMAKQYVARALRDLA